VHLQSLSRFFSGIRTHLVHGSLVLHFFSCPHFEHPPVLAIGYRPLFLRFSTGA